MRAKKILFVGFIEKVATNGESMKNRLFIERFNELYDKVYTFNAKGVKHNPLKLIKLILFCLFNHRINVFVSASPGVGIPLVKLMWCLGCKNIYYWMVGGSFHEKVKRGELNKAFFQKMKWLIVQSPRMLNSLIEQGFTNVYYISNSKRINYLPDIAMRNNKCMRFVFLSRINPTKGCEEIVESARQLNRIGYQDKFRIDFYGAIDKCYASFPESIKGIPNVSYNGFLDLTNIDGYNKLAEFDMMLFPTYWDGEGFPGVIIDSYIAGVPVLASDWSLNCDYVNEETGIIIPHHNQQRLFEVMKEVIDGKFDLKAMAIKCQGLALRYDNRTVITEEKMMDIGAYSE